MNGLVLDPILPGMVVALLGVVLLFLTVRAYWRVGWSLESWRNAVLLVFRLLGIALVLLLLLQPSRQEKVPPPTRERITLVGVDTSLSMKQRDVERASRFDAARNALLESGALERNGLPASPRLRLFEFSDDARPIAKSFLEVAPAGKTTRFHKSVSTLLGTPVPGEAANALILLTDGHDFELVNPVKTGSAARARQVPIYAVALGKLGKVRDVSVRITGFQPYCYVKQKARVAAALRLIGCEFETLGVDLLRHGQVVQTKRLHADELQELPVEFEITEAEVGQFEYEVRVQPLEAEVDPANNSAITYLNVIDQQLRILVLEGDPYWDTTFLQRSLMRNDKFEVDALLRYGQGRVRAIRKTPVPGELRMPETLDQFGAYDVVILGRAVDRLMDAKQHGLLERFVKDRGGTVVFARGHAFESPEMGRELEPVLWDKPRSDRVRLEVAPEGRGLSAFRALGEGTAGPESLPELLNHRATGDSKPLTATLAVASGRDDSAPAPAIVQRRYGLGQVVSVGVEGLWRWGLNAKIESQNAPFDRFWDQMIVWLVAGRDFIPSRQFSFRPNSANILLGEKVHFRMTMRTPDPAVKSVALTLFYGEAEISRTSLAAPTADPGRLTAEFLPERVGRYRARAAFPDGTTQESRFIVFTENQEETEVAADGVGLRRLCESSGGRLIEVAELGRLLQELDNQKADVTPKTRLRPVWNTTWVFYLAGLLFGADWFWRRRWGLS